MKVVAFEGQISAGKTTTLKALAALKYNSVNVLYEPIENYRCFRYGNFRCNPLDMMLKSKNEIFAIQNFFLDCMNAEYCNAKHDADCSVLFLDRSFLSCMLFINLVYHTHHIITDFEYYFLNQRLVKYATECFPVSKYPQFGFDKVVYFNQSIPDCLLKIKERNRPEELGITDTYLQTINEEYKKLLQRIEPGDILTVNSPCDQVTQHQVLQEILIFLEK